MIQDPPQKPPAQTLNPTESLQSATLRLKFFSSQGVGFKVWVQALWLVH